MTWRARLNRWRRWGVQRLLWRPVFGETAQGRPLPHTRISPATLIEHEDRLVLGDHVYIGPFNLIEASGGITLGEGVQVTSHCTLVTHSSHRAMRLLGRDYVHWDEAAGPRPGWVAGPITIGAYSFIGPHCLIEAGSTLGRGTLVSAGTFVRGSFPDFAVLAGHPARVVGDSRERDAPWLVRHPELRAGYDAWTLASGEVRT